MSDVFVVTSQCWDHRRDRIVLALDKRDARQTHQAEYPFVTVVRVVAREEDSKLTVKQAGRH
jgi:hypothetical protein